MDLEAADAALAPRGKDLDLVPRAGGPAIGGPRHDGAEPRDGEGPVDGQEEGPLAGSGPHPVHQGGELALQGLEVLAGDRGDRDDGLSLQKAPADELLDVLPDQVGHTGLDPVRLRDGDEPVPHPQELQDGQMLAGLGHDALVGGDDQEHGVYSGGPRHHLTDEALVSGDVDDTDDAAVLQTEGGEAQLDGDSPLLLLQQAVAVHARQCGDQGRLAVVDVPGGAQHQRYLAVRAHASSPPSAPMRAKASTTSASSRGVSVRTCRTRASSRAPHTTGISCSLRSA